MRDQREELKLPIHQFFLLTKHWLQYILGNFAFKGPLLGKRLVWLDANLDSFSWRLCDIMQVLLPLSASSCSSVEWYSHKLAVLHEQDHLVKHRTWEHALNERPVDLSWCQLTSSPQLLSIGPHNKSLWAATS